MCRRDSTPTIGTIRTLVERAKRREPALASRLERAAFVVLLRRVDERPEGGHTVESDSEPGTAYIVDAGVCECPDYWRAPEHYCKHRLAVLLLAAAADHERERRQKLRRRNLSDERVAVGFGLAFAGGR
jgi:hypothetical protein